MKRAFSFALFLILALMCGVPGLAVQIESRDNLYVVLTAEGRMESNFEQSGSSFSDSARELQPGDFIVYTIRLINRYGAEADWYMKNEVINSLERVDNSARGGAYAYRLSYIAPNGAEQELYSSATVGGTANERDISDDTDGLKEATNALKDYFFLDTIPSGKTAEIVLRVDLDGETQGNDYQDTLADLQMQFAAEPQVSPGTRTNVVKTGDDTNWLWIFIVMLVTGLIFIIMAVDELRKRRKENEEESWEEVWEKVYD